MKDNTKNILLGVLAVGLIGMTVAFAALSTTLRIGGTANVAAAKWDIHFENWAMDKPATNLAGVTNTATQTTAATPSNGTLINGLVVELPHPGDTISYTFDIVNDGTINAKLSSFTPSMTATKVVNEATVDADTSDLTYTVECGAEAAKPASGAQTLTSPATPAQNNTLAAGNSRACKLTISYNVANNNGGTPGQTQTYIGEARTVDLSAGWVWVQD